MKMGPKGALSGAMGALGGGLALAGHAVAAPIAAATIAGMYVAPKAVNLAASSHAPAMDFTAYRHISLTYIGGFSARVPSQNTRRSLG